MSPLNLLNNIKTSIIQDIGSQKYDAKNIPLLTRPQTPDATIIANNIATLISFENNWIRSIYLMSSRDYY